MSKRRIALVGIGKIARDQHVPSIAASVDWELAATVSRNGRVDGVEHFIGIEDMLAARPDIEVVSLCLPPIPRYAAAVSVIRAGRHVMLEKPPGATLAECQSLERLAREAGVSIYATWHSREADRVAAAKAWLRDRRIERLEVTWKEDVRRWHPGQDWIFEIGGLGVFDPGINAFSILTEILPDPFHIDYSVLHYPENRHMPIAAEIRFAYPGAKSAGAVIDFRQEGPQTWSIEIETDGGKLALHDGGARMEIDGQLEGAEDISDLTGEYLRLYARMAALVAGGESDMDLRPMTLVADAFLLGERRTIDVFDW